MARSARPSNVTSLPISSELPAHGLEQQVDIDRLQRLIVIEVAKERERAVHHALHLIQLLAEARLQRRVIDLGLHLKPQPRQGCLEVMGHGREHARAAVEISVQAVLHGVEGARRAAQLPGALLRQLRLQDAAPEVVRRRAQAATTGRVMLRATTYSAMTSTTTSRIRLSMRLGGSGVPGETRVTR